ncbi:MAG TPA: hypothetical protein VIW48_06900 [Nitrospiraceae bacterium]
MSGQNLDGKVSKVGMHAVALSELAGMEFFDAMMLLDQVVSAVITVRNK